MIKLGVLGMSEGNGHPYSWSAIFNGYDPLAMGECEFPVIPAYLAEQNWPDARLAGGQVTHIWTQDWAQSARIARAALIGEICSHPQDMIGQVDAVLLARDDAQRHLRDAAMFIEAGLPIYIDKPLALGLDDLQKIYALEQYEGQIFTCSALRYADELRPSAAQLASIGQLRHIQAIIPKAWETYAVHLIEPVLALMAPNLECQVRNVRRAPSGFVTVEARLGSDITAEFTCAGAGLAAPLEFRLHGTDGYICLSRFDTFAAFKAALADFCEGIRSRTCRSPRVFNEIVVNVIEAGCHA